MDTPDPLEICKLIAAWRRRVFGPLPAGRRPPDNYSDDEKRTAAKAVLERIVEDD